MVISLYFTPQPVTVKSHGQLARFLKLKLTQRKSLRWVNSLRFEKESWSWIEKTFDPVPWVDMSLTNLNLTAAPWVEDCIRRSVC